LDGVREGQLSHAFLDALVTNITRLPMDSGQKNQKLSARTYISMNDASLQKRSPTHSNSSSATPLNILTPKCLITRNPKFLIVYIRNPRRRKPSRKCPEPVCITSMISSSGSLLTGFSSFDSDPPPSLRTISVSHFLLLPSPVSKIQFE